MPSSFWVMILCLVGLLVLHRGQPLNNGMKILVVVILLVIALQIGRYAL